MFTADIGQNFVWTVHDLRLRDNQHLFMSPGNGPMGYSLPAAIGVYYATHRPVISLCGDGGMMMNLQEMQYVKRENLPIKIICYNNHSLGMIRAWQERYLNKTSHTSESSGYLAADFEKIAKAFNFKYILITDFKELSKIDFSNQEPEFIEIVVPSDSDTKPRDKMSDQNPPLPRDIYEELSRL